MELERFISAMHFSNAIENETRINFQNLVKMLDGFKQVYDHEKSNLPYHINLIDELHADENAHSRILAKLLRYKLKSSYPFLEKFLKDVCSFDIKIENPTIEKVDSCGRIDIPIFDKEYVVVIENKVTDKAIDQNTDKGGQLARYIETINTTYNRTLNEIFVVYTPKYTREPSNECWINEDGYSYKEDFKSRYRSVSYRDDIYPWLKNEILPNISEKDLYLRSAVEQYIDYLEGTFSLRKINKNMNMKLQDFIKKELSIEDDNPEKATEILSQKEEELNNALNQIQQLKNKYKLQIIDQNFEIWKALLSKDFPNLEIVGDKFKLDKNYINIGIKFRINELKFVAIVEWKKSTDKIYFGIGKHFVSKEKHSTPAILSEILKNQELTGPDNFWYGWKYTSIENAYMRLKNLIEECLS